MIGFIGIGNMASAILSGALTQNYLKASEVNIFDIDQNKMNDFIEKTGVYGCQNIQELIEKSDLLVMAIKPQHIQETLIDIKDQLKNKALVSIALGYDFNTYQPLLDHSTRVLFVMPNTPCLVGEGMSLFEQTHSLTNEEFEFTKGLFKSIGEIEIIPSSLMGIGGAMSGCSPAYVYMMIEAMADAGVMNGMPRDLAYKLASQTLLGAGKMQKETSIHPGVLKDQVCSPGGSTIRGVSALEKGNFRSTIIEAINQSLKN